LISRFVEDSRRRRTKPFAILALCLFISGAPLGFAHRPDSPAADAARITAIAFVEDGRPASPGTQKLISLKPGDIYSSFAVSEAVKQAFGTGLFSDIRVIRSGEKGLDLTFELTRRLLVRAIRFRGEKSLSSNRLGQALVSLRRDGYFSEERLASGVAELRQALAHGGYFQPRIRTDVTRETRGPEVVVTFMIDAGSRYTISDVRFEGNLGVPADELLKKLKTRPGRPFSLAQLERDLPRIKAVYARLGYPRVEVETAPELFFIEEGTVSLLIKINPGERVEIIIRGAKIPVSLVQPIWEGPIFEEWGMSEGEARILSELRGKGYIFASVRSSIDKIENGISVIYVVDRGKKYRIREVAFDGNRYFTATELRNQLAVGESVRLFGGIDGKKVFDLPDEIEVLYQAQGFDDVQVNLHFRETDSTAIATCSIAEGKQRRVRSVEFTGASLLDAATLRRQVALKEGGPYFTPSVQRDIQILETYYLNQGIRGTRIEARAVPAVEDEFDVTFSIREGFLTKVQGIFISGNLVTRTGTVMKEIKIKEGEPARMESIVATRASLEKLAVFSEVRLDEVPLAPGSENLVVRLREGERNYVGLGIGLETRDELTTSAILSANLRPRGTAEFMRSNIFGRAAHVSLVSQFSLAEKRLILSWEQPYLLFSLRVPTYFSGWIEEEDRISFGYKREGVSVSAIKPFFWDLTLLTALKYARTTLYFLEVAPNEIDREFYPYSATSFETSLIREKRNDPFNPSRGYFSSLSLEYAFPLFNTESDFLKMAFKYQRYFTIVPRLIFGSTFRLGLGAGRMPIHERFFAGGSNSFRGERFDELGPRDPQSGKPVGGKAMVLFNFELAFPLVSTLPDLAGAVFYDAGNVFVNRSDFGLDRLEHAVGGGIRYRTPLGPVRLELGWNLTDPARRGKPIFFITIGNVF
jgi:outer membrane protein insertion porin family